MRSFVFFVNIILVLAQNNLQTSNNFFSAAIYKKISKNSQQNFVVSPFSLETLLAVVYSGSSGETAEEIKSSLNFSQNLEANFKSLITALARNEKYTLRTANRIYIDKKQKIKSGFRAVANEAYRTKIAIADYSNSDKTAEAMNHWMEKLTNNKISNLITPQNLHDNSKLVILSGLYFKANWSMPFPVDYTRKDYFYLNRTERISTPVMYIYESYFKFYESKALKAKFLELPFKGTEASMVIVLPNEVNQLSYLETHIRKILKLKKFKRRLVNVALPIFRVETKSNLNKILKNMGINAIFNESKADLSPISGKKGDLVVDKIIQKSFIDVNEMGVDAGTGTYMLTVIPINALDTTPIEFKVDRPFIFYIKVKGVIMFIGRVVDPRK